MSRINETLKAKIDELDLDRRLNVLVEDAERAFHQAVAKAGTLAHEHRDDVDRTLDSLSERWEQRTEGRYADRVEQVRARLETGLDRLAEHRPPEDPVERVDG